MKLGKCKGEKVTGEPGDKITKNSYFCGYSFSTDITRHE
jgi:hypothetical protein